MHTEKYCDTIDSLHRAQAIRAIHQAWLQLRALTNSVDCDCYDNRPTMAALADCLRAAGHPGFVDGVAA